MLSHRARNGESASHVYMLEVRREAVFLLRVYVSYFRQQPKQTGGGDLNPTRSRRRKWEEESPIVI